MIIISKYAESDKGDGIIIIICNEECICPICHSQVCHRDWKLRIMKLDGGEVRWYLIERRRCTNESCRKLHNLLPDIFVPYKHYAGDLIAAVLDGDIQPEDPMNEDYPCDETMCRWLQWFQANASRAEGHCIHARHYVRDIGLASLQPGAPILETVRKSCCRWLASILRMVYNSGGCLVPS